jgi:myosin heavy subunit
MIIANPIYDVVFKYLLEDIEIACELLSTILGVPICSLTVKPQETLVRENSGEIKMFRLDFKAVIDLANGQQKTVLIELQKAKKTHDILRFRGYLGDNYIKTETRLNKKNLPEEYSLEIIALYILGFQLLGVDMPVLKVGRKFTNVVTQEEVKVTHKFITNLTHESYTIQIPHLKVNQQNQLEQVLEIFSQDYALEDLHKLDFKATTKNPFVQKMLRRLAKAAANEDIKRQMDAEDSFDRIMARQSEEKDDRINELEEGHKEKDKALEEKDKALEEKDKALEENAKALEGKDKALEEKDKALEGKDKALEEKDKELEEMKRAFEEMKRKMAS